ncbi:NlpC/P60 family protein [Geomesophilobacter sediminis]|uniref:C40 family peptidase n=1 Tax=Geomesophilobacter sediminis TaxID=2798584 RepID=A0A8J7M0X0_9BACT|nr:NlpC/P60 family protein [Geomesophilobacter sediminis]MBJ6726590.1 C40 family peptidase [Geomesophilobacter sediminis]
MKRIITILLILLSFPAASFAAAPRLVVAQGPTPVLNTPDFPKYFGGTIKLDPCVGVRPIEFVALPGTLFQVEGEVQRDGVPIYRVTTADYPYPSDTGYFVDSRFVAPAPAGTAERARRLPSLAEVQRGLLASLGKPYVWGGNWRDGIAQLTSRYPNADPLAGVDCSGLLYQATDGVTPRNTSALTSYGRPVAIAGLSAEQIARKLEPLDLIVWKGHVMIVLDRDRIIESVMACGSGKNGVELLPIQEGVRRVMKTRRPLDDYRQAARGKKGFVVRRWFPAR